MANPTTITWTNPVTDVDGNPYGVNENAGYEIKFDSQTTVTVLPGITWGTSFDMRSLPIYQALPYGNHTVSIRAVSKGGLKSAFSAAATFPKVEAVPQPPTGVSVV